MNISAELDRHKQRYFRAIELRETYYAAGLRGCGDIMNDEVERLEKLIARLMAERAQQQIAARKEAQS